MRWTFGHLDIWTFGHLDIWTFGHLDIWKKNMINWCGREIYGKLYKKVN